MDLLPDVPSWADLERKINHSAQGLGQSAASTWDSASNGFRQGWNGVSQRVSGGVNSAYEKLGGRRIDCLRQAMSQSYPTVRQDLMRRFSDIGIDQIIDVLLDLAKQVAMILGGSIATGGAIGGAAGAFFFGVGAVPGAAAGAGIGLEIGNLILMGLGLSAIAQYFYEGLPACLTALQKGITTAWNAPDDGKAPGLDPSWGATSRESLTVNKASWELAQGQEQLILLLLTAIVTYLLRGQIKGGLTQSAENIAARGARLQAEIKNKQLANWLARNQEKLLAKPELQPQQPKANIQPKPEPLPTPSAKAPEVAKPVATKPAMSLADAVGKNVADYWTSKGREIANLNSPSRSALLSDDQIGALFGYTTNEGYQAINPALRGIEEMTPQLQAFADHATEGLSKLPAFTGAETFRGTTLPTSVLANNQMGAVVSDSAFFSTSAEKAFSGPVQITTRGVSGRDISFLSGFPEAEVLYPPGTQFEVLNRIDQGSVTHLLYKEIP